MTDNNNSKQKKDKLQDDTTELSQEDKQKKEDIELIVERTKDLDENIQKSAIEALRTEVKSSKTSISSIPKGLKFLRAHYSTLKDIFESCHGDNRTLLADVMSVLAMTMSSEGSLDSLKFRLAGTESSIDDWGHEYVRNLSGEIIQEFANRQAEEQNFDDLMALVDKIIPFNISHNSEPEACDLLLEVERLQDILQYIDETNYDRICLYLLGNANYAEEQENALILGIVLQIYRQLEKIPQALFVAMLMDNNEIVQDIFENANPEIKKQIAFMLGRQRYFSFEIDDDDEELGNLIGNMKLSEHYHELAKDLSVEEPKAPKDLYKMHLIENRHLSNMKIDSAKENLADTFVNGFANAGFGTDTLLLGDDSKKSWIFKTKQQDRMSVVASMGLLYLWDSEEGSAQLDTLFYSDDDSIKAGAYLGMGISSCGIRNIYDLAMSVLGEYITPDTNSTMKIGAILGMGLAYAGTAREDILEMLTEVFTNESEMDVLSVTGYALGLVFVGTCNPDIASSITEILLSKEEDALSHPYTKFLCLGLGLLYLGKQSLADMTLETLKVVKGPMARYVQFTVETCAYTGTGNVEKVQELLTVCGEHLEENNEFQAVAVMGIALIAMGEEIGSAMSIRAFNHLLQYGEPVVRRTVPLALGLLSISNPNLQIMDTLSKLSHDTDGDVAQGAIYALGLIGAGTNNSRIADLLRQLSAYYCKDPEHLFIVRIAQGLIHLGKGLISLNPFSCHGALLSKVAIAGLLGTLHAFFDLSGLIHSTGHFFLYMMSTAMQPRMLMTVDEELKTLEVPIRVGQAVDTVGQAGKPKTITGFQTHSSPVLIANGERAELATDEYICSTPFLENCVILKPNPNASS